MMIPLDLITQSSSLNKPYKTCQLKHRIIMHLWHNKKLMAENRPPPAFSTAQTLTPSTLKPCSREYLTIFVNHFILSQ
jgi:hypothetical protein